MSNAKQTTIMLVDDTPTNLILLGEILHAHGYRAVAFPSGALALRAACKNPPDLILLDIRMPEMDGFEVCQQLKENEMLKDIPVIFISAIDDTEHKLKAFQLGGVDYVTKPFQEAEVLARVATHLRLVTLQNSLKMHNENLEQLVAQRTQELADAHTRLLEMDRLKDDFLHMISHEIRTPANGILGMGELLITLCTEAEENESYADAFRQSSERLQNLIADATMLADMDHLVDDAGQIFCLSDILDELTCRECPFKVILEDGFDPTVIHVKASPVLLKKALSTAIRLAGYFSSTHERISLLVSRKETLEMRIDLDALSIQPKHAGEFFTITSAVRASSRAEPMGLAPVVAQKILGAFGGGMQLVCSADKKGHLLIRIPAHPFTAQRDRLRSN